jgi:hypothetical protein
MSEQVLSKGCELRPGILLRWTPALNGPQPIGMVQGQVEQADIEQIAIVTGPAGWAKQMTAGLHVPEESFVRWQRPFMTSGQGPARMNAPIELALGHSTEYSFFAHDESSKAIVGVRWQRGMESTRHKGGDYQLSTQRRIIIGIGRLT